MHMNGDQWRETQQHCGSPGPTLDDGCRDQGRAKVVMTEVKPGCQRTKVEMLTSMPKLYCIQREGGAQQS